MTTKTKFLLISLFLFATSVFGQTDPPPAAVPSDSATILIDRIIQVTKHEKYFTDYCKKEVNDFANKKNWTKEKTDKILASISFKQYKPSIHNAYVQYSVDQLVLLLEALISINKNETSFTTMIVTNPMMQNNLDVYVDGLIQGV